MTEANQPTGEYRDHPYRWSYSHIEGLKPEFVGTDLLRGSAFLTAAQIYYERQIEGQYPTIHNIEDDRSEYNAPI